MPKHGDVVRINSGDNDSMIGNIVDGDGNPWWTIKLHGDEKIVEEKYNNITVFDDEKGLEENFADFMSRDRQPD